MRLSRLAALLLGSGLVALPTQAAVVDKCLNELRLVAVDQQRVEDQCRLAIEQLLAAPLDPEIASLRAAIDDPVEEVREQAAGILGMMLLLRAESRTQLTAFGPFMEGRLAHQTRERRVGALRFIAVTEWRPGLEARAAIITLLNDRHPEIASLAAAALTTAPQMDPEGMNLVLEKLETADGDVRSRILGTFQYRKVDDPRVVAAYIKALTGTHELLQDQAMEALAELGPKAAAALPELEKLAAHEQDDAVREKARSAISKIRTKRR
ncbi:MAG: HEAT repeat domain-containing protein [Acidobacteria bacterium]|nr:HEAT repeat domain-containing protein [Acidobacteriota bacterium]